MSQKKCLVSLTEAQIQELQDIIRKGKHSARKITRARILLEANDGKTDAAIAETLRVNVGTVKRMREKFVHSGNIEAALRDAPYPPKPRKLDGDAEAFLVLTVRSDPPEGKPAWTLRLLGNRLVEAGIVESISDECVRGYLKKANLSLG